MFFFNLWVYICYLNILRLCMALIKRLLSNFQVFIRENVEPSSLSDKKIMRNRISEEIKRWLLKVK